MPIRNLRTSLSARTLVFQTNMMRLKEKFIKEVIPAMRQNLGYKSNMAVPKIEKVVLNTGFGRLVVGKTGDEPKKIVEAKRKGIAIAAEVTPHHLYFDDTMLTNENRLRLQ